MPPILHPGSSTCLRRGGACPARSPLRPAVAQPFLAVLATRHPPHYTGTVDRRAKAGDNFMSTSSTGVAAISEEGE
jgi:hypothetical protein